MATLIPSLGSARFDTRGELRKPKRLKDFLEENACLWHTCPWVRAAGIPTSSSSIRRTGC